MSLTAISEFPFAQFIFRDTRVAPFWLAVRLYVGWEWLHAGWLKVANPAWVGLDAGGPVAGFAKGALAKTVGEHPDVQWWYAAFLENVVVPHPALWSNLVAYGELMVGIGLIVGLLTGLAAFFGFFMNMNYLLAGTVSINPQLLVLSILLILACRIAGYWGLDRFVLPWLEKQCRTQVAGASSGT